MFLFIKTNIRRIIKKIYEKIFKEKLTLTVRIFFKNLNYAIWGYGIAAIFIFIFQILVGRILGPSEYGKYALVDSVATFLFLFMTLGVSTATIKYNAEREDYLRQQRIISSSYWTTLIISFILTSFFLFFSHFFSRIFSIPLIIFRYAVIFAICYTLYILATDILRSLHQIKKLAIFRAFYGFLILFFFYLFLLKNYISFPIIIFVICFTYLLIFLLITVNVRNYLLFKIDRAWIKNLLEYGLYVTGGSFLLIFLPALSKIMVNKFLTVGDVGIYNAYYFFSINVAIFFNTVFITVFFPTASKYPQKSSIFKKIKKITPFLFLIGVPILFGIQLLVLKFFGQQYPIDYWLMLLFAISGVVFFIFGLYIWFFYSKGIAEARLVIFLIALVFVVNILLNFYLIPRFLLRGAVISLILTYLVGWIYLFIHQKKLLN